MGTPDVSSTARAVSAGLGQVVGALDQIVERDATAEADTADAQITSEWLKWDAENRPKYRGANVGEYQAQAADWWKKSAETYGASLSPLAKQKIGTALTRKQNSALTDVTHYITGEKERHADASALASLNNTIELGVTTGDTGAAALRVREMAQEIGGRKGWDAAQREDFVRGKLDDMHAARIVNLARTDAEKAAQYAKDAEARGELSGVRRASLKDTLEKAASEQRGEQKARSWAKMPFEDQLVEASKITDVVERKAAEHVIIAQQTLVTKATKERADKMEGQLLFNYTQTRRRPSQADLQELAKIDPKAAAHVADSIDKDIRARLKEAEGKAVKTDIKAYFALREAIRDANGNVPISQILQFSDRVSRADLEELGKLRETLQKDASGTTQKNMFTEETLIRSYMPPGVKFDSDTGREVQRKMQDALVAAREIKKAEGKKGGLTDAEMKAALDPLFEPVERADVWFGGKVQAWQIESNEKAPQVRIQRDGKPDQLVVIENIPNHERQSVVRGLADRGVPVTRANIARAWLAAKEKLEAEAAAKRNAATTSAIESIPK